MGRGQPRIESSADLPMAMWGILMCGAAYLPLATDYPPERLAYMVKDAAVQVIVTNDRTAGKLQGLLLPGVRVVNIDHIAMPDAAQADRIVSELAEQAGADLAYVIYTSGTTGKPKGVAISHQAIVNQMRWIAHQGYLGVDQVILQKTPVSFDAAQWELLGMCCGAKVVMGLPGVYRDPEALIGQIRAHGVTTLQGVPTLLQALSELPEFFTCPTLRTLFSGGEGLSRKLAKNLLQGLPHIGLVNLYGPTECTINATHFRVDHASFQHDWEIAPIGLPVAGLTCHVLDQHGVAVAPGQVGELHIGGGQLAIGYLFRPEQTEEKFPQLSLAPQHAPVRLYRTGDLVRQDGAGVLHFVSRLDNQIKFRGYRIELDEIRLAIENHDWVKSAAVFVKENVRTGHAQLIGCVALNPHEARLMDQGAAESHHQTKSTRVQTKAQLSGGGFRSDQSLAPAVRFDLAGRQESAAQRARVFARKTYRFFHGGALAAGAIGAMLAPMAEQGRSAPLAALDGARLGEMLRYLGQFSSDERLLPKFGYASPGALYATQVYVELNNVGELPSGYYYYHPVRHSLYLLAPLTGAGSAPHLSLHFVGKVPAIRAVYKNNILEVLEMETGHILGMLDHVLPGYGYGVGRGGQQPDIVAQLNCPDQHAYLASVAIVPLAERVDDLAVDTYVQVHPGKIAGLDTGSYLYRQGQLHKVSDFVVEQRHVIAINQQVYQRASGGVSFVSRAADPWRRYIIRLAGQAGGRTVFCWPGLGGYPMNLRQLGEAVSPHGAFYGMQARGINAGETACDSIEAMAAEDVRLLRAVQPTGPYTLWGYSFGARVAYEVAYQLEQLGETVARVVLLAPGSPLLPYPEPVSRDQQVLFANPAFLTILLSVFSNDINPSLSTQCRLTVSNRAAFIAFVTAHLPAMDEALINAIIDVVAVTYSPNYQIALADKTVRSPVEVWRANGDGPSFAANAAGTGLDIRYHNLAVGHYAVLKTDGITELLAAGLA